MKLRNLWEYTAARSSLLSKRIYLSTHEENIENGARGKTDLEITTSSLFCTVAMPIDLIWMSYIFYVTACGSKPTTNFQISSLKPALLSSCRRVVSNAGFGLQA